MPYDHFLTEKMRDEINHDNIYQEGTVIRAKSAPELRLVILRYRQRIYYCEVLDHPDQNNFAYFERELIPPTESDQQVQFRPVDKSTAADKNYVFKNDRK